MSQVDPSLLINQYMASVADKHHTGHAREHAYRPVFEQLMSALDPSLKIINDPSRSEHGNPDFVFLRGDIIIGYTETKDIGVDLDKIERSNQMQRYLGYSNLILTDYLEFRFFRNGERYGEPIRVGQLTDGRVATFPAQYGELAHELVEFLKAKPESIRSGKRLAEIMGAKAQRIRANVARYLAEPNERNAELEKIFQMMRTLLVHDLSPDKFADMYAQTLVYGLFVARYNDPSPEQFTRQEARDLVPASNPFLREFFDHIVGPRFDKRLGYIVDELCEVFSVSDVREIVHRHLKLTESTFEEKDPIIHFYEDFLKAYDPTERKKMGAYYTPIPVVRFIVRMVDEALKRDFGLPNGLADSSKHTVTITQQSQKTKVDLHRVQILDPAVGTATFLNEIIKSIWQTFKGQEGRWPSYVERDLVPRLYGFELMMAPYTIAHLKLGLTLQETGVKELSQRLGVYLTNTLEEGVNRTPDLFTSFGLAEAVSNEAVAASAIKHERPIMVVIGNPPYSGVSSNETEYANQLIAKYKVEPGGTQKLQERKHWLNDDYVRFIAFAEDMIAKNGTGVVGMITNHGYLDNPTFRGMRWQLTQTFDTIHVLDLHGNSKKKETTPDGNKDENVFDIQQGVAIIVAVKTGKKRGTPAKVYHAELFGTRRHKFDELQESPKWKPITLDPKLYYFVPKNNSGRSDYDEGVSLAEFFLVSGVGIVTGRDSLTIDMDRNSLIERVSDFIELQPEDARKKYKLGKDSTTWQVGWAQESLNGEILDENVVPISYRPFDNRYCYYVKKSSGFIVRPNPKVMKHFLDGENTGLLFSRMTKGKPFAHAFVTQNISEVIYLSPLTGTNAFNAPLWLYHDDGTRTANFQPEVLKQLTINLTKVPEPEHVLDYIYAALHSPIYRKKYAEFLKTDFPRVPVPTNDAEFVRLVTFGARLRELHLLTAPNLASYDTTFPIAGSNGIERIEYKGGNVWINADQYFGNVPDVAWMFYIGGYQPAQKWLKDRKGRVLTSDDIEHYQKIVKSLLETHKVMQEIDKSVEIR